MRKLKIGKLAGMAFVLVALTAGCGREQAVSPAFPAVIATVPVNGATGVLLNTTVTATFNTVMNPATINATTFTLTGPGAVAVAGAVSYSGTTATFTPASSLAASTVYVATITTGAKDPAGNSLAAQLTAEQIKEQIAANPDLTPDDRQQMLNNLSVMVLANNRRVDVMLSTTGQQSTHRYPFNARDYLALISTKGGEKEPRVTRRKPKR